MVKLIAKASENSFKTIREMLFTQSPAKLNNIRWHSEASPIVSNILSKQEAKSLKPLRVRIQTVNSGNTIESLSRKMQVDNFYREEHFRVINGVEVKESIVLGRKYKIIAD